MSEQAQAQTETQGQAIKTDQAPSAPSGTEEKGEQLSPQFAALARKEKAIRLEAQKIKAEREAFAKERDQFKSPGYITKDELMKNPIGILTSHGWSPDQIAQMLLSDTHQPTQQDQERKQLLARIEELEGKHKKVESRFDEQQTQDREQAIGQIRNEVKVLVDSDEAFETIKASNKMDAVVEHITQTYDEDGVLLSVEDAATEVENALVEEAMKLMSLSKIKDRLNPPVEAAPVKQQGISVQQRTAGQPIKTLTHDMSSAPSTGKLTEKDRVKRAVMRAQGLDPDTGKPIAG